MASWEGEYGIFGVTTGAFGMFQLDGRGMPPFDEALAFGNGLGVGNGTLTLQVGDYHPYGDMNPSAKAEVTVDGLEVAYACAPLVDSDTGYTRDEETALRDAYTELTNAILWRQ